MTMKRKCYIGWGGLIIMMTLGRAAAAADLVWHDVKTLNLMEGQGWADTEAPFDRLPAKLKGVASPATWSQSKAAAGLCARFRTDAPTLTVRWQLTGPVGPMMHMTPTAVSGVDFYKKRADGVWIFSGNGRPDPAREIQEASFSVNRGRLLEMPECRLYFPLYNGVSRLEIGIPKGSVLTAPERQNPCVEDRSRVVLDLTAGAHDLLIAFDTDRGRGWGLKFRFLSPDDEPRLMAAFPEIITEEK